MTLREVSVAQCSYTLPLVPTHGSVYELLADICGHLPNLDADLVSIVRDTDDTVTITFTKPIPDKHAEHLGIKLLK